MEYNFSFGKRASLAVGVMVIVTLLLFIFILVKINTEAGKVSENFDVVARVNDLYAEQQGYESTLYFKLVEDFLNSYQKVLSENSNNFGNEPVSKIESLFRENLDSSLRVSDENSKPELKALFSSVDSIRFDGETVFVDKSNWKVEKSLDATNSKIDYLSSLDTDVSFDRLGLPSFLDIERSHFTCHERSENEQVLKVCLESEFPQFEVEFNRLKPGQVSLISKNKYYLGKDMKSIVFTLTFNFASQTSS